MGEDSKKGFFNAGMAQAERIDILQRVLNDARFNITQVNMSYGKLNYEIMIKACEGLLKECWGKLTPEEKVTGTRYNNICWLFLKNNAIIIQGRDDTKINNKNLNKLEELINKFENLMREYLEEHGLNNPNKEEDDEDEL